MIRDVVFCIATFNRSVVAIKLSFLFYLISIVRSFLVRINRRPVYMWREDRA